MYILQLYFANALILGYRAEKITKAMEGMDSRVEKYRQDVEARKPVKNLRWRLKRVESIARAKSKLQLER
jgi:hypothetical protein